MPHNREEIIWAAGFFDGEGWVGAYVRTGRRGRRGLNMAVQQSHRYVLDRFQAAVGMLGIITGPYAKPHQRPVWRFSANSYEHVQAIGAMLYQFLSPIKQEQFIQALKRYQDMKCN